MALKLLIEATIAGTLYRISDEHLDLTNKWLGVVTNFSGANWRLTTRHGGYLKYQVGDLGIHQNFWTSSPPPWPPTQVIYLACYYTLSTEAAKVLMFSGVGYRTTVSNQTVTYALYPRSDEIYILDTAYTRNGVQSVYVNDGLDASPKLRWQLSGSGTTEYYLQTFAGTNPGISEPDRFSSNLTYLTKGTAGSLADLEWDYANNDSLTYSTIYVRYYGTDPDIYITGTFRADYGGTAVAVPRAFGPVINKRPVRLPDIYIGSATPKAVYDPAGIAGTGSKQITNITNAGGGLTTITSTSHGFSNGDTVTVEIQRGDYYNGDYVVSNVAANTFDIPKTYVAPTVTTGHAYKSGYWRFYEAGNPYIGIALLSGGLFVLNPPPTGEVTVSGTGYDDAGSTAIADMDDVVSLVAGRLSLTADVSDARSPSPAIAHWETEQSLVRDWLGLVLGYYSQVGWEDSTYLYAREFAFTPGGGSTAVTEFDTGEDLRYEDENRPLGALVAHLSHIPWDQDSEMSSVTHTETNYAFAERITIKAYHYDADLIAAELAIIAATLIRRNVVMKIFDTFFSALPDPADRYIMTDTYTIQNSLAHGNVCTVEFDFDQDVITVVMKQITSSI